MASSPRVFHVLLALSERPLHGYAVRQRVTELSGGRLELEPGGLYRLIGRLEDDGLVEPAPTPPDDEPKGPARRYYRLTPAGERLLAQEARRLAELVDRPEVAAVLRATP